VFLGAGGGEGAWDGEEDGLFGFGEVGDCDGLEVVGGGREVGEGGVWEGGAYRDGGGDSDGGCCGGGEFEGG